MKRVADVGWLGPQVTVLGVITRASFLGASVCISAIRALTAGLVVEVQAHIFTLSSRGGIRG